MKLPPQSPLERSRPAPPLERSACGCRACAASRGSTILAARREAKLVATVMVGHDGHRGWVYYLAVAPAFRRQGVGTMLMRSAEQWCRARGVPKLQLMVRSENVEVASFYAALGYDKSDVVVLAK
ncbi:MAG TPA: GNAT family acetyltransferase [Beijerinckiaceae bacterium]|nr:GNAT family acetyltransferase [Beijerinckiaceae bacterium]